MEALHWAGGGAGPRPELRRECGRGARPDVPEGAEAGGAVEPGQPRRTRCGIPRLVLGNCRFQKLRFAIRDLTNTVKHAAICLDEIYYRVRKRNLFELHPA